MSGRAILRRVCLAAAALLSLNAAAGTEDRLSEIGDRALEKSKQRDLAGAIAEWSAAIELQPRVPLAYVCRANARTTQREYDKAEADFAEAVRLSPDYAYAYAMRGMLWLETSDFEKALTDGAKAIELAPDDLFSYFARGYARTLTDDFDGAIADFKRMLRPKVGFPAVLFACGRVKIARGSRQGGLEDIDEAVKADPQNFEMFYFRGIVLYDQRDWKSALADFRQANAVGPLEWAMLRAWAVQARLGERDAGNAELRAGLKAQRARLPAGRNNVVDWGHQVGSFLLGELKEDELLAAAASPLPALAANKACEACYFAAMRRLADGDKPGAIGLLRRTLQTNRRFYSEWPSAVADLQEMLLGMQLDPLPRPAEGAPLRRGVGLAIARLIEGGPAQRAGLREGDTITGLGNQEATLPVLRRLLAEAPPSSALRLKFLRAGAMQAASLALGPW